MKQHTEINTLLKILTQEFVPELWVADWGEAELFILIVLGGTQLQLKAAVLGGAIRVARPQLLARPHLAPALRQGRVTLLSVLASSSTDHSELLAPLHFN